MICHNCPRGCKNVPFCKRENGKIKIAKIMRHYWEEPPISGTRGTDAVFFSGCNLACVFCQNAAISRDGAGEIFSPDEFANLFIKLVESDSHSISLITPSHYSDEIAEALKKARDEGFNKTIIYNSSGYENVEALRRLDGLVDVYLPDFKYFSDDLALKYSKAPGYRETALAAIVEMIRQKPCREYDSDGIMRAGVLIRHLVLPVLRLDSINVIREIAKSFPTAALSLMRQYTPDFLEHGYPELDRKITSFEYDSVKAELISLGITDGFEQSRHSASGVYVPEF